MLFLYCILQALIVRSENIAASPGEDYQKFITDICGPSNISRVCGIKIGRIEDKDCNINNCNNIQGIVYILNYNEFLVSVNSEYVTDDFKFVLTLDNGSEKEINRTKDLSTGRAFIYQLPDEKSFDSIELSLLNFQDKKGRKFIKESNEAITPPEMQTFYQENIYFNISAILDDCEVKLLSLNVRTSKTIELEHFVLHNFDTGWEFVAGNNSHNHTLKATPKKDSYDAENVHLDLAEDQTVYDISWLAIFNTTSKTNLARAEIHLHMNNIVQPDVELLKQKFSSLNSKTSSSFAGSTHQYDITITDTKSDSCKIDSREMLLSSLLMFITILNCR